MSEPTAEFGVWKRRLSSVTRALLVVFLAFFTAVVFASVGRDVLAGVGLPPTSIAARVWLTVLQFLGFGAGVVGFLALGDSWDLIHLRRPEIRDLGWVVGGVAALVAAALAVGHLLSALGVQVAQNQVVTAGRENPEFFLYMIPVSLLFVGPFEELVFRGAVQGLLRRAWGTPTAIVVASGMFGVVHWLALTGGGSRVSYVAVAAMLGVVLGALYERSRTLVVPAAVHGSYNALLFGFQYLVATGQVG